MGLIVQKFGGTSVANKERLENAKSDFNYRLQLAQAKAEQKETTLKRLLMRTEQTSDCGENITG